MSRLPDLQQPEAGPARQALTASRKLARKIIPAAVKAVKENPDTVERLVAGASGLNPPTLDFGAGEPGAAQWVAEAMADDVKSQQR
jgi:hypothetical protein